MKGMLGHHMGVTRGGWQDAATFHRQIVPPRLEACPLLGVEIGLNDWAKGCIPTSLAADKKLAWVLVSPFRGATSPGRVYGVRDDE